MGLTNGTVTPTVTSKEISSLVGYQFDVSIKALTEFMNWWASISIVNTATKTPLQNSDYPDIIREIYKCGVAMLHG